MKRKLSQSNVTHKHKVALLIIDMLNTFEFPEGEDLARLSEPIAQNILKLKHRLKAAGVPVLYVNDNFGQWQSSWPKVYERCAQSGCLGEKIANFLKPEEDDYFVLKPKHSAFFSTNLDVLLAELGTETLILTGIAGNICVFFTANDAHMREYEIVIPRDCVASNTVKDNNYFLNQAELVLGVKVLLSRSLRLSSFRH